MGLESFRKPRIWTATRSIASVGDSRLYGPACAGVQMIEMHIWYVLLTGQYAYKIKKTVRLPFLDFSTLEARRFYCERELELNRRAAPSIYLEVVPITGTADAPRIGGGGAAIEYAVKMTEFPPGSDCSPPCWRADALTCRACRLAGGGGCGVPSLRRPGAMWALALATGQQILELALENFTEIDPVLEDERDRRALADAAPLDRARARRARDDLFADRQRLGFVRECHGDLHLGNIALVDGTVAIFDCIEFNDEMRWSDVMADVAFLAMDLEDRGRPDCAARFLNGYLELSGDYDGVQVLRFYVVYRALVRAKIACLRAEPDQRGRDPAAPRSPNTVTT